MAMQCDCLPGRCIPVSVIPIQFQVRPPPPPQDEGPRTVVADKKRYVRCRQRSKIPSLSDIDLCEIEKRTKKLREDHNDMNCHLRGEKNQNIINKIKMFLDCYDDRVVMKSKGGSDTKKVDCCGPMIKYPGYVDYDHCFFKPPYNKLPCLAETVGGRRICNPCKPIRVHNWDLCYGKGSKQQKEESTKQDRNEDGGQGCRCAERSDEDPRCQVALASNNTPYNSSGYTDSGSVANFCIPVCYPSSGMSMPPSPTPSDSSGQSCNYNQQSSPIVFMLPPRQLANTPSAGDTGGAPYMCIPMPGSSSSC